MMATWFQGPFRDFIRVTQEGWAKGVSILHFLGGPAIGYQVKMDMPMLKGPVVEELYRRGSRWVAGGALER